MTLSRCPWWWAPVLAPAWICTVPAHSFCAPTRAKLIAAARFMPGVCGVLVSRDPAGMTRTPECFQRSCGDAASAMHDPALELHHQIEPRLAEPVKKRSALSDPLIKLGQATL